MTVTTLTAFPRGMPCWADVSTTDPQASREFYAGLLGWTYEMGSGYYTIALVDDIPVAALSGVAAEPGPDIAWTLYVASRDARVTATAITRHGGQVLHGPMRIPGQGTMLFSRDPAGAGLGVWQPAARWRCRLFEPAALWWAELYTPSPVAADEFYTKLFRYDQAPFGPAGDYTVWSIDGTPYLGRAAVPADSDEPPGARAVVFADGDEPPAARWQLYFAAPEGSSVDATATRAAELGGTVQVAPFDHSHGRVAVLADPAGASFTVIDPLPPGSARTA